VAIWSRLTSGIAGFGIGAATADAVTPELEPLKQTAWRNSPHRVLGEGTAAALRARQTVAGAEGIDLQGVNLADDAARQGIGHNRFDLLTELARREPDVGSLIQLRRRGIATGDKEGISTHEFRRLLRRSGYEVETIDAIVELLQDRLEPPVVALAIVRGILHDPGFLPVGPPTKPGKVKAFPVSGLDALDEAQANGMSRDRLFVQTAIAGRPMGPEAAAAAVFRDIIEPQDYQRAIAEGDVRNEWAQAIFETARQIPSVADYVNARIRGWITEAEMNAGTARHGMSPADTHLLYLRTGRPAAPGQMATAAARGIHGPDGTPMDRKQFLKGIAESDIRPEWGPMLWESRFLYPPLFQLTRLVQAGAIDADTAREWAVKDRYPPEVVTALHAYWTAPSAAKADTHLGKAQTQLWTTTHRSYLSGESDDATATAALQAAGVTAATAPAVLALWQHERDLVRKQLTPAQVKKAWAKVVRNEATGAAWTRDDAIAELIQRGYTHADATTYLDE